MKGDFTRRTFDPKKHYSSVLMQQGRVTLDADWNEQVDIATHRVETETADIIGGCGAAAGSAGFEIGVPGLAVFSSTAAVASTSAGASTTPAAARTAGPSIATGGIAIGPPIIVNPLPDPGDLIIGAGHYYVDGILCENESPVSLSTQPDLPGQLALSAKGLYVIYLDVWKRHLTALDDPSIREVALGGPDTATRSKVVWQVKALPISSPPDPVYCSTSFPEWDALVAARNPHLRARTNPAPPNTDPCGPLPAGAGFRGLENQLYRVEIHTPGVLGAAPGAATFKWQRDNASIVTQWLDQNGSDLKVSSTGRDSVLNIAAGQWVELIDDKQELNGLPGTLVKVTAVQGDVVTIDPGSATISRADFPLKPRMRRWDSPGEIKVTQPAPDGYISLESGVEVRFEHGSYQTGDYWLIPARTLTADVEWPGGASPAALPPRGIQHHYCRLALVSSDGAGTVNVLRDCRCVFPRLCQPGIHITNVVAISDSKPVRKAPLLNDNAVRVTEILGGIDFICDGPVAPAAISRAVCFLTVDVPFRGRRGQSVAAYQRIVLAADVSVSAAGNTIQWRPKNGNFLAQMPYHLAMASTPPAAGDLGILARVVLNGNYIWNPQMPSRYLDGEAFGVARPDGSTDWRPPSGNGASGGDFEMWFWLTPEAQTRPLTFKVEAAPTPARWEGFNELVGEIVLKGTGGTPTENGNPIPTYNIVVSTDPLEIASPQLSPSERIDVVLLIDEPTGFGYSGHPRLFLGERISTTSTKSVLFQDVPLESPVFGEVLTLRIKNLRVNATPLFVAGTSTSSGSSIGSGIGSAIAGTPLQGAQLARSAVVPAGPPDTSVKISVSVTIAGSNPAQPVVVENPKVVVASALPGVSVAKVPNRGQSLPLVVHQSLGFNPELLSQPAPSNVPISFYLEFTEGFPNSFRVRKSFTPSPPGQLLQESGFEGPYPLYFVGNSETGTRLRVIFESIPENIDPFGTATQAGPLGVQIFVTTHNVKDPLGASTPPVQARLAPTDVFAGGAGSVPNPALFSPETGGLASDGIPLLAVPFANGSGEVEWEWVAQDPAKDPAKDPTDRRKVFFGVVAAALPGLQSRGRIRVRAGLAPITQPTVPSFTEGALEPLVVIFVEP